MLIHPFSSLLSAYGMGLADIRATRQQAIEEAFGAKSLASLNRIAKRLAKDVSSEVAGQGVPAKALKVHVRAHIRYAGTDTALVVKAVVCARSCTLPWRGGSASRASRRAGVENASRSPPDALRASTSPSREVKIVPLAMKSAFEKAHKAQFGFIDAKKDLVIEAVSVEAVGGGAKFREKKGKTTRGKLPSPARRTKFFSDGKWHNATVYTRDQLAPGHKVKGPAIVIEPHQTVVVEPGWQAAITAKNHLVLARVVKLKRTSAIGTKADPIMLEVFNNLFMSIAEQMGVALQNTAYSVNIKERLDFSCAVFAHDGTLGGERAAHAGASRLDGPLGRDDHPRQCGPHQTGRRLRRSTRPTTAARICRTSPFARRSSTSRKKNILFWVASRGHHADVGGISPGSMSPNATTIHEEGVCSTTSRSSIRAVSARRNSTTRSTARNIRRAIRCRTSTT